MKYFFIIPDGLADLPLEDLNGKTPVEVARTPNLDFLAKEGVCGVSKNVPKNLPPGSDVACLSLFGFNPTEYYTGRAPFEAASKKIVLKDGEIAFRCNFTTIFDNKMIDYSGGHISNEEAKELIRLLNSHFETVDGLKFYPGVSYRNLAIIDESLLSEGKGKLKTVPPHDIMGKDITEYLPSGKGSAFLIDVMKKASKLIETHEINNIKIDLGENPANSIWLWGEGKTPNMPSFEEKFGLKGAVISAVDLVKGISICAGLDLIEVPGATGYLDTDYSAKGRYAVEEIDNYDIIFVHIEAPDEAGHNGNKIEKVQCIEQIDDKIIGPVIEKARELEDARIIVSPDHPTPISLRTHTRDKVPFAVWGKGIEPDNVEYFSEQACKKGRFGSINGHELLKKVLEIKGD